MEGRTGREYLEDCLRLEAGHSEDIYQKNKIGEAIVKYFVDGDCLTLIRPIADEARLAHIEEEDFESLKPEFKEGAGDFVKGVHAKAKPKILANKYISPQMLLNLAMEYTEQINSKETPTVLTSLDRVVQQESQRIMDDLEVDFKERISDLIPQEFGFMTESGQREDVDIKEVFNNLRLDAMKLVHTSLSQILSVDEIIQRYNLFMKWLNS